MDLGQSRRGVDMGPSALRVAGLQARLKQLGHHVEDIGKHVCEQPESSPTGKNAPNILHEIAETCQALAELTEKTLGEGFMPLVLGGDHSIALGSLSGASNFTGSNRRRLVICGWTAPWRYEYAGVFAIGQMSTGCRCFADWIRRAGADGLMGFSRRWQPAARGSRWSTDLDSERAAAGERVWRATLYDA